MKKCLYLALAMPMLFACSSEDFDEKVVSNDRFAGIAKVDATFSMDEGPVTRLDGPLGWTAEENDLWGFAWLGGGEASSLTIDGKAWQNHNLIQTNGIFTPQTSIYVGNYYLYRPYDKTTVNIGEINFKSLEEQPLAEGYASSEQAWKDLAKTAINIGDKWTNVTLNGRTDSNGKTWDKAGIQQNYEIYAAVFSNQTGLDLTFENNNVNFDGKKIAGASDIDYTYPAGSTVGAVDIYEATVELDGAAKSFTYAPTESPSSNHDGSYWADKSNLGEDDGFAFTSGAITLKPADGQFTAEGETGWFWFNSLPVAEGDVDDSSIATKKVTTKFNTSYGEVTVEEALADCAYEFYDFGTAGNHDYQWAKLVAATNLSATPKELGIGEYNTFVNQYGNHKGKYVLTVDFSTGVMDGMHIVNDAHLQKALKYYIASGKTETVVLNLDQASSDDNTFKISKISIALLQTINASGEKVKVQACTSHGTPKIIVTQEGQDALGLADKKEVPALDKVFAGETEVYLAADTEWTWTKATALPIDDQVKSITNEGTLTVTANNIELSETAATLANAADATMNITKVTTVKNGLTNLGTINVGADNNKTAELRAYGVEIKNDATSLTASGTINNYGVVGVTAGTSGKFNNYGLIDMKNGEAITLLTSNEIGTTPFKNAFGLGTNMMGTVVLPDNNPTAIVSVSNTAETGFIKYTWPSDVKTYVTPEGNVKYNTVVVSGDIQFTERENEIQYIEFNGTRTKVINDRKLSNVKGVIVNAGKSIIIEKGNRLNLIQGAYLGEGATVYKGGEFVCNDKPFTTENTKVYLGEWSLDQIVEY